MMVNKQLGALDYGKLLAALLVVAIHTAPLSSYSVTADFLFTRVFARIAVPFFLMTTGYFLLPQYLFDHSKDFYALRQFAKKILLLYAIAIVIYFPINLYAGHFQNCNLYDVLRMLVFDGTFYHLWYLPGLLLGVFLIILLGHWRSFKTIAKIALVLYGFGLLGDSYFGLIANFTPLRTIYNGMFQVFSYTRNGIFYVPIFLLLGASCKQVSNRNHMVTNGIGFVLSMLFMLAEGMVLNYLHMQRHDSMYIALLPCMFFLFRLVLSLPVLSVKKLRTISTTIYMIHPLVIILVRGVAKFTHLEAIFIENSLLHYITVCALSAILAICLQKIVAYNRKPPFSKDRAWIELDSNHLQRNVAALKELLPVSCELMPVLKANAYGHGAVLLAKELNRLGIISFCVATISEGIELRKNGIKGDILILGYTHPEKFSMLRKYHLMQTVIDYSYAQSLNAYGKQLHVHLKIDTGMHRLGERAERMEEIRRIFDCKHLVIEGVFTHLSAADSKTAANKEVTLAQAATFQKVVSHLCNLGYCCGKVHLLSSYGLINYPELGGDYARAGIALYGLLSKEADLESCPIKLYPVLSLKARVAMVKDLYAGETAGYGLQSVAKSKRKIAVLTIGYGDGLSRTSSQRRNVLIKGRLAPVIGRTCMDQLLVDVTDIPNVKSGDEVVLLGKSGGLEITAYDFAKEQGTITNEALSQMGSRLTRIIV